MQLQLVRLPELKHFTGKPFPASLRLLAPDAAAALMRMDRDAGGLSYTDIWRSPALSLAAVRQKKGVQPPGFSGHNFGIAVDFDVDGILKAKKWKYGRLVELWEAHGWYGHRRDRSTGFEAWHANFLGADAAPFLAKAKVDQPYTWSAPAEAAILARFGKDFALTLTQVQEQLAKLGLYHGAIDGKEGPQTLEAVRIFQRTWGLVPHGVIEGRTKRVLALVAADKVIAEAPSR